MSGEFNEILDLVLNDNPSEMISSLSQNTGENTLNDQVVLTNPERDFLTPEQTEQLMGEFTTKLKEQYPNNPPLSGHERIKEIIKRNPEDISLTNQPLKKLSWVLSKLYFATHNTRNLVRNDHNFVEDNINVLAHQIKEKMIPNQPQNTFGGLEYTKEVVKLLIKSQPVLESNQSQSSHISVLKKVKECNTNFNQSKEFQTLVGDLLMPTFAYAFSNPETGLVNNGWNNLIATPVIQAQGITGHIIINLEDIEKTYNYSVNPLTAGPINYSQLGIPGRVDITRNLPINRFAYLLERPLNMTGALSRRFTLNEQNATIKYLGSGTWLFCMGGLTFYYVSKLIQNNPDSIGDGIRDLVQAFGKLIVIATKK